MEKIVKIPAHEWYQLKGKLDRLIERIGVDNMINEDEAAKLLGITTRSLKNKYHRKELEGMYTVGVGGNRFYYKDKLMGLNKKLIA